MTTDNYKKHTSANPLQKFLINNFFRTLLQEAGTLNLDSVLDAGCGEGFTLDRLAKSGIGKKYAGIDYSANAIKLGLKTHPDFDLRIGDIYKLPFKDNSFDLVICTEVLEHLKYPEKAVRELFRVSKNHCIISVPREPWFMIANFLRGKNINRLGNDIEHIQHWSAKGINRLISRYFSVVNVSCPFPWTLVTASKYSGHE